MGLVGQVPNVQSVRFRFKKLKFQIQSARCIPIYLDFFGARSHGTSLSLSLTGNSGQCIRRVKTSEERDHWEDFRLLRFFKKGSFEAPLYFVANLKKSYVIGVGIEWVRPGQSCPCPLLCSASDLFLEPKN